MIDIISDIINSDFGEIVVYRSSDGLRRSINAIVDSNVIDNYVGDTGVTNNELYLILSKVDVPDINMDCIFMVRGNNYQILEINDDGLGAIIVRLTRYA